MNEYEILEGLQELKDPNDIIQELKNGEVLTLIASRIVIDDNYYVSERNLTIALNPSASTGNYGLNVLHAGLSYKESMFNQAFRKTPEAAGIKRGLRERVNFTCQLCKTTEDELKRLYNHLPQRGDEGMEFRIKTTLHFHHQAMCETEEEYIKHFKLGYGRMLCRTCHLIDIHRPELGHYQYEEKRLYLQDLIRGNY